VLRVALLTSNKAGKEDVLDYFSSCSLSLSVSHTHTHTHTHFSMIHSIRG